MRAEWLAAVRPLLDDIVRWSEAQGWRVSTEEKEIREKALGTYTAPRLEIDTETVHFGRLTVEPIAWSAPGARGAVDFFAWASRDGVQVQRRDGAWIVHTASGIDWPHAWGRDTFLELAKALIITR